MSTKSRACENSQPDFCTSASLTICFFHSQESWFLEVSEPKFFKFNFLCQHFLFQEYWIAYLGNEQLFFVIFWTPLISKIGPNFCQLHTAPFKKCQNFHSSCRYLILQLYFCIIKWYSTSDVKLVCMLLSIPILNKVEIVSR